MKKIISLLVFGAMLACAILPVAVSADILWTDDFSTKQENDWIWEGDEFEINNEKLEGWAEAVVHQSNFLVKLNGTKRFKECAFKVTAAGLEDGGKDADEHFLGLWWADYINPSGDPAVDNDGQLVYTFGYKFETHSIYFNCSFDGEGEAYEPADHDPDKPLMEIEVPLSEAPELDPTGGSEFTLGMRIRGGVISCFLNDKKYVDFTGYRGALTGTQLGSPILFWNGQCHCTFDDFVVATADHNLFNETPEEQQAVGVGGTGNNSQGANNSGNSGGSSGGNGGTKTRIETTIDSEIVTHSRVIGIDENGNEITTIESEIVTVIGSREVADTDGSGSSAGRGGSATGDAAIVVIAVMVVALGSAIVVAKKTSRSN